MKWILIVIFLGASALGQNAYGPDFLNLHCTTPDPLAQTLFNIPPRPGLVPDHSPNGNVILYCDSSSASIKASFNGGAYSVLGSLPTATAAGQVPVSTGAGTAYLPLSLPNYPEAFTSWNPGTLYPAVLSGTCTFAASTTATCSYPTTFSSAPQVQITPVNPGTVTFTLTAQNTANFTLAASASNSLTVNYSATLPSGINCNQTTFNLIGARQGLDYVSPLIGNSLPSNVDITVFVSASDQGTVRACNFSSSTVTFSTALNVGGKVVR